MSQNLIIPSKDNRVVMTFAGVDLTQATNIVVTFGSETYSTSADPLLVIVDSDSDLSLDLSGTAEVGKIFATVTYIDGASTNGTDITSQELNNLGQIIVAIGSQLIIEDGTGIANSNSYVTDSEYKAYANIRGKAVGATQPEREANLILAMDYIESHRDQFKGQKTDYTQSLQWPRVAAYIDGYQVNSDYIPLELKRAQMEAALIGESTPLLKTGDTSNLASFSVDGVYSESYHQGGSWQTVRTDTIDVFLQVLLNNAGGGINAVGIRA
jgi:hypothetical protein